MSIPIYEGESSRGRARDGVNLVLAEGIPIDAMVGEVGKEE